MRNRIKTKNFDAFPSFNMRERITDITFSVTEECNLRCKYCYLVHKNNQNKMDIETAKKAVDYILSSKEFFSEKSIVWSFIGGEPLLQIDLIDEISDYIKIEMYKKTTLGLKIMLLILQQTEYYIVNQLYKNILIKIRTILRSALV